ncbi:MAG: XRE family transcriptional regulator [Roseibium sp.]|uniref:helix-turn-helix domain-containing protein n=1 Tax=Roseibium sp. TaxID=1936156 RepID=UPI00261738A3|nr:XRE family transcriptional regulator [Roseibium sp.]MCV0426949.1 XRE family transcriptional regulator [Roseibium sp.]
MSNVEQHLARRLIELRRAKNWPLEDLAEKTGISRATLSRIERGDTSPTALVLGKLASAFGVSMAELFGAVSESAERHVSKNAQPVWLDPETGFRRRSLTPAASGYRGTVIEGMLPAGETISYDAPPVPDLEHHLVLLDGKLRCTLGPDVFNLEAGDALRFRLNAPNSYHASGKAPARYLLTVITP